MVSGEPACWIMAGYASGCCTAITGMPIHWREVECVAMGHAHCRVIGRPLKQWEDLGEAESGFLKIDSFVASPSPTRSATTLDPAFAIKFTITRLRPSGSPGDPDIFGSQQYAPLLDIEIAV